MFYFDGNEWRKNKYKITYTNTVYDDDPGRYPGGTVEEVTLTPDQEARFAIARNADMVDMDFLQYVLNGVGMPPDTRTDIEKLIDLIPPESMTEDVVAMANRLTNEVV